MKNNNTKSSKKVQNGTKLSSNELILYLNNFQKLLNDVEGLFNKMLSNTYSSEDEKIQIQVELYYKRLKLRMQFDVIMENKESYQENENMSINSLLDRYKIVQSRLDSDNDLRNIENTLVQRLASQDFESKEAKYFLDLTERDIKENNNSVVQVNLGDAKIDIERSNIKKRIGLMLLIIFFVNIVINVLAVLGLSGLIKWQSGEPFENILYFALYYTLLDNVVTTICHIVLRKKLFIVYILDTIVIPIISILVVCIFPIFVSIESYFNLALILLLSMLIKSFVKSYILEKANIAPGMIKRIRR